MLKAYLLTDKTNRNNSISLVVHIRDLFGAISEYEIEPVMVRKCIPIYRTD
jgi:hypothetical protein